MFKHSIFVPVYNGSKFIENICKNINKQSIKPNQIIIIDDTKNLKNFSSILRKKLIYF